MFQSDGPPLTINLSAMCNTLMRVGRVIALEDRSLTGAEEDALYATVARPVSILPRGLASYALVHLVLHLTTHILDVAGRAFRTVDGFMCLDHGNVDLSECGCELSPDYAWVAEWLEAATAIRGQLAEPSHDTAAYRILVAFLNDPGDRPTEDDMGRLLLLAEIAVSVAVPYTGQERSGAVIFQRRDRS